MASKRALADIFAGAEIIEAYGQTESTDGVLMARGGSVFTHEGTVGTMNPHVHVAIRRHDGSLAADDEEGEIVIGGPTVMQGYYRNPKPTPATSPVVTRAGTSSSPAASRTSSSPAARTSRHARSRTCCARIPPSPTSPSSARRTRVGASR
jgi:acyl-CoA synthetase (AMP-forming)/AMP-acid ligase II